MKFLNAEFELNQIKNGKYKRIIGVDEVGRGAWAGPVVVGAFVFDTTTQVFDGVIDSKKLSAKKREVSSVNLLKSENKLFYKEVEAIDQIGIGNTLTEIIKEIIGHFNNDTTLFLIDGYFPGVFPENIHFVKKGDLTHYSIAAASIIAKVSRDLFMDNLHKQYPDYGFNDNKGYGTKKHIEGLSKLGITPVHRKSYKPIQKFLK